MAWECKKQEAEKRVEEKEASTPKVGTIPDVQVPKSSQDAKERQPWTPFGKIRNQPVVVMIDSGSTHKFISEEVAQSIGLTNEDKGMFTIADTLFGQQAQVVPVKDPHRRVLGSCKLSHRTYSRM